MTQPPSKAPDALAKVRLHQAVICVVGLGYVGLPTAVAFAQAGFRVIGADVNQEKVTKINGGESPLQDLGINEAVRKVVSSGRLSASIDVVASCREADCVLLTVPTPVNESKQPDLKFVAAASAAAARGLHAGQLIVLESTTYPGTTEDYVIAACRAVSDMTPGIEYGVAYCPERYNPGDPNHRLDNVFRVVGAINPGWGDVAAALYGTLNGGKITRVRDLKTAEAAKVIENIQRDINIALTNEFALIFDRLGIDTHEVLDAAATKWNFVRFSPGPGVGGHCLPVDPYYLTSLAQRVGYHPQVILAGRAVNDYMPHHVVELVTDALNEAGRPVAETNIAILGLSYKANTGDARESPASVVVRELRRRGARLRLCDPYIPTADLRHEFDMEGMPFDDAIRGADAVLLMTDHREFRELNLERLQKTMHSGPALIDTRNVIDPMAAQQLGFIFRGVGRLSAPARPNPPK